MLPAMVSAENKKVYQAVNQLGINMTDTASDGELSDAVGLTTEFYPTLRQRKRRTQINQQYANITDVFEWDNKLVIVDGTTLYYDGEILCSVLASEFPGQKQFAVVNTQLIVWPDKIVIDMTNNTFRHMDEQVTSAAVEAVSGTELTIPPSRLGTNIKASYRGDNYWYYGLTDAPVWQDGQWVSRGEIKNVFNRGIVRSWSDTRLGDALYTIPYKTVTNQYAIDFVSYVRWDTSPDVNTPPPASAFTHQPNTDGVYAVVRTITKNDAYFQALPDSYTTGGTLAFEYDLYDASSGEKLISDYFSVGDIVNVTGTRFGWLDRSAEKITNIVENTITFSRELLIPDYYYRTTSDIETAVRIRIRATDYFSVVRLFNVLTGQRIPAGSVFLTDITGEHVSVYDGELKNLLYEYNTSETTWEPGTYDMTKYDTSGYRVTIQRDVPQLDYITAHENRLWAVSNSQENEIVDPETGEVQKFTSRMIYSSALGLPDRFYDYDGVSTDSWAVADGSDEDFTGIASYGGGVLCFKEHRIFKILGAFPAEYYMQSYMVEGVQRGSYQSLTTINDVLYYKGIDGVYAYTGNAPVLISASLGADIYTDGHGGGNEHEYVISMKKGDTWYLFTYDIQRGLWMITLKTRAASIIVQNNVLKYIDGDGKMWSADDADGETVIWTAEYAPTYETHTSRYSQSAMFNRKDYVRVLIRVEVNGVLVVEYRTDDGEWKTAKKVNTDWTKIVTVPLPPMRCDKFQLRLSGTGEVCIRSIERELTVGSEK